MDSLHFYLFHLFECGLRLKKEDKKYQDYDNKAEDDEMVEDEYYDKQFAKINGILSQRQRKIKPFERLCPPAPNLSFEFPSPNPAVKWPLFDCDLYLTLKA